MLLPEEALSEKASPNARDVDPANRKKSKIIIFKMLRFPIRVMAALLLLIRGNINIIFLIIKL